MVCLKAFKSILPLLLKILTSKWIAYRLIQNKIQSYACFCKITMSLVLKLLPQILHIFTISKATNS